MHVLLVEDNPADAGLVAEAFNGWRLRCDLHVAEDGAIALQFLQRAGRFVDAPRPDLVLLDLNLPKKNGREVLQGRLRVAKHSRYRAHEFGR